MDGCTAKACEFLWRPGCWRDDPLEAVRLVESVPEVPI